MEGGIQETLLRGVDDENGVREEGDLRSKIWIVIMNLRVVAAPIFTRFLMSLGAAISQAFVGHIGATELAAYTLVVTIFKTFAKGLLLGMASGLETLCGQAYDERHDHMLGVYLQRSWVVLTVSTTLIMPFFIFATPILKAFGQDEIIAEEAGKIALWFIPVIYSFNFSFTCEVYLNTQRKNRIILYVPPMLIFMLFSWLLTVEYEYGLTGVMVTNLLASLFASISVLAYVISGRFPETWKGFSTLAFRDLCPLIKLCLSSGAMRYIELWYDAIMILLTGNFKNAEVAIDALSICRRFSGCGSIIYPDLLAAASVRVSNELERGDSKAAKFSILFVVLASLVFGIELSMFVLFFLKYFVYIFTNDGDVAAEIAHLSPLLAFSIVIDSVQPVLSVVATVVGWQRTVVYVKLGCNYLIGITFGYVLGYIFNLQVQGVWTGMIISTCVQTIILIIITLRTDWHKQISIRSKESNQIVCGVEHGDHSRAT